ncbi:MAG: hypothetical protein AAGJ08_18840 [Cyanobacteria bacterium P01_H01_bin.35]
MGGVLDPILFDKLSIAIAQEVHSCCLALEVYYLKSSDRKTCYDKDRQTHIKKY